MGVWWEWMCVRCVWVVCGIIMFVGIFLSLIFHTAARSHWSVQEDASVVATNTQNNSTKNLCILRLKQYNNNEKT